MYLFQPRETFYIFSILPDLHSTMYLFQLSLSKIHKKHLLHLHSTMYLFQPARTIVCQNSRSSHLHSTMYLFQLLTSLIVYFSFLFTFHYVSISTKLDDMSNNHAFLFTFHYVSISTYSQNRMTQ